MYRMELTCDEIMDVLDIKVTTATSIGYTIAPSIHEISEINLKVKSLLPDEVKLKITTDDIRLESNLATNNTKRFTQKFFFYTILSFPQSHSRVLGDI